MFNISELILLGMGFIEIENFINIPTYANKFYLILSQLFIYLIYHTYG